jgi:glycyl-tRNA synthetase alpha subunit
LLLLLLLRVMNTTLLGVWGLGWEALLKRQFVHFYDYLTKKGEEKSKLTVGE